MSDDQFRFDVAENAANQRLDKVLAVACPSLSRSRLQALLRQGQVEVDGQTARDPAKKMQAGQHVVLTLPPPDPATPEPQALALDLLFEDDDLLVLNKPAGLVVHPAPGNPDRTLVNALLAHCGGGLTGIGGVARPGLVHRLDKGTSGVMVVAKTDRAYQGLQPQFADHTIERQYLALVWRAPTRAKGRIETQLGRAPHNRKKMAVLKTGGRHAVTHFERRATYGPQAEPLAAQLACRLETGRTHQIRVHLTHLGHPLIGDPTYGRGHASLRRRLPETAQKVIDDLDRPALHAHRLGFHHPFLFKQLAFEVPPPADWRKVEEALKSLPI